MTRSVSTIALPRSFWSSRRASRWASAAALVVLAACSESTDPPGGSTAGASGTGAAGSGASGSGAGGNTSGGTAGSGATGAIAGGSAGSPAGAGGSTGGTTGSADSGIADASGAGDTTSSSDSGMTDAAEGSAGRADADSGDAGGLTFPIQRGDRYVLEFGSIFFEVAPAIGARITSLRLDGDEVLTGAVANARFYGSTLWTSPASDWQVGVFDPPSIVDRDPYATTASADGVITATNVPSTANGKRFTITKVFRADIANQTIVIDYRITNNGAAPFQLSHWEVTRVLPNGLTFFPTGTSSKVDFLPQIMQLQQSQAYTWYDSKTHLPMQGESKAGAETPGGFIAHVAPNAKGDVLFIKSFKDVPPTAAPTGHFEVELFCSDAYTYVELEDHSPYDSIAPGATYTQTVNWYLRRLPVGTDRSVGSTALIAAVKGVLGR